MPLQADRPCEKSREVGSQSLWTVVFKGISVAPMSCGWGWRLHPQCPRNVSERRTVPRRTGAAARERPVRCCKRSVSDRSLSSGNHVTETKSMRTGKANNMETSEFGAEEGVRRAPQGDRVSHALKTPNSPKALSKALFSESGGRGGVNCCKRLGVRAFGLEVRSWPGRCVAVNLHQTRVSLCSDKKGPVSGVDDEADLSWQLPQARSPDPIQCHRWGSQDPADPQAPQASQAVRLRGQVLQTTSHEDSAAMRTQRWGWGEIHSASRPRPSRWAAWPGSGALRETAQASFLRPQLTCWPEARAPGSKLRFASYLTFLLTITGFISVQSSVVSDSLQPHGLQHARPLCPSPNPGVYSTHVHWVADAIQPSHPLSPLLLPPSIFPSIRVFSNESVLHIWWPKYWEFQPQHQSFQWIFRTNFL